VTDAKKIAQTSTSVTSKNANKNSNPQVSGGKNINANNTATPVNPATLPADPFAEENAPPAALQNRSASTQIFDDGSSIYENPNAKFTGGFTNVTTGAPEVSDLNKIATSATTVPIGQNADSQGSTIV
jgi:hypothetical protein